ncbi:hypothetical protein U9M48_043439, partial [Paspalum notatum var. saurae]
FPFHPSLARFSPAPPRVFATTRSSYAAAALAVGGLSSQHPPTHTSAASTARAISRLIPRYTLPAWPSRHAGASFPHPAPNTRPHLASLTGDRYPLRVWRWGRAPSARRRGTTQALEEDRRPRSLCEISVELIASDPLFPPYLVSTQSESYVVTIDVDLQAYAGHLLPQTMPCPHAWRQAGRHAAKSRDKVWGGKLGDGKSATTSLKMTDGAVARVNGLFWRIASKPENQGRASGTPALAGPEGWKKGATANSDAVRQAGLCATTPAVTEASQGLDWPCFSSTSCCCWIKKRSNSIHFQCMKIYSWLVVPKLEAAGPDATPRHATPRHGSWVMNLCGGPICSRQAVVSCAFKEIFDSSTCLNHVLVTAIAALLIILLVLQLLVRTPSRRASEEQLVALSSPLRLASVAFHVLLGLVYLGLGLWMLGRSSFSRDGPSVYLPHWWLATLSPGVNLILASFAFSIRARNLGVVFVQFWSVLLTIYAAYICCTSIVYMVAGNAVTIKACLDVLFLPGALLLLIYGFWHTKDDNFEGKENAAYKPLNTEAAEDIADSKTHVHVTPFAKAGFLSVMSFWWLNPLMKMGYEKPLEEKDLPLLGATDQAYNQYLIFWEKLNRKKQSKPHGTPSFFWTIVLCHKSEIMVSGFFALLKVLTLSSGPVLLNAFINVSSGKGTFKYEGFVLAAVLFFCKCCESLSERQWFFRARRLGLQVRSFLSASIYKKQQRLSSSAKMKHSSGEIMNYVTVDAYRIGEFPYWFHQTWTTSVQLCIALAILYNAVGLAMIASLFVIITTVLCNAPLAKLQHKFQSKLMEAQDVRLKAMTESLIHMKILKLYAWETHFKKVIEGLREVEYKWLSAFQLRRGYNSLLFWSSPVLVSAATFLACYLLKIPLDASNVFTFVATLRLVQNPIRQIPEVIGVVIQAKVAFTRITKFLDAPELNEQVRKKYHVGSEYPIRINSCSFSWNEYPSKPTLKNINLVVRTGGKVAICGEVGSGKSTLLSAVLGEVLKTEGEIQLCGKTAYVSQNAWIQTGTVQDNILFGSSMDKQRYQETLLKCSLVKDLELLLYGDHTQIGERGVNLSGGQRQRVQLARALYQNADIYLLDDPFSAVDAHTATSLFNEYVMGALSDKTVLLVTHQVDFLPVFDCILFRTIVQGDLSITDYCRRLKGMADSLGDLGEKVEDCTLVLNLIRSLNERFADIGRHLRRGRPFPTFLEARFELLVAELTATSALHHHRRRWIFYRGRKSSGAIALDAGVECSGRELVGVIEVEMEAVELMSDGEIVRSAPYQELLAQCQEFRTLVSAHKDNMCISDHNNMPPHRTKGASTNEINDIDGSKYTELTKPSPADQLIKREERETGDTGLKPYMLYLGQKKGFLYASLCVTSHMIFLAAQISQNSWMAANVQNPSVSTLKLISVYIAIGVCSVFFILSRTLSAIILGIQTSRSLFSQLLNSLFRAPMSFFDSTPLGRVLSRVSSDLSIIDLDIPLVFMFTSSASLNAYSNLGVLAVVTWQVLFVSVPMIVLAVTLQRYYLASAKELMRINGTTKSALANHLGESILGAVTIRAFEEEDRFFAKNLELVDKNASPFFYNFAATEWLIQRLEIMTAVVLSFSAFVMALLPTGTFSPGFVGMALSYGLSLNVSFVNSIQRQCSLANQIISVERVNQYMDIQSEAAEVIDENRPAPDWPQVGKVEFKDLKIRYRKDSPLVLHGITSTFEGGHKIGIVGRTGSGKTTLIGALFRLVEPAAGTIIIDSVDITTIGLHDLRSRLGIIPQEPTLFQGTVRYNLDPLGQFSDQQIWEVLDKCQLLEAIQEKEHGLDSLGRGLPHPAACPLCDQSDETIQHLLISCVFAREVWTAILSKLGLAFIAPQQGCTGFTCWWRQSVKRVGKDMRKGLNSLIILVPWQIWKHRNSCVFEGTRPCVQSVVLAVVDEGRAWCLAGASALHDLLLRQLLSGLVEDGSNWSMGQRQLFCLGRALLRRCHILVLDEATASIDNTTDAILQKTIRTEFKHSTVIIVAHRIPTVMDCNMVLAMNDGKVVEYDKPMKLMETEGSLFWELVNEYWRSRLLSAWSLKKMRQALSADASIIWFLPEASTMFGTVGNYPTVPLSVLRKVSK